MCKIPEVVLVLACKLEYMFVQPRVKRLQKKIIGEEIFGDSLNFLNCICKARFLLLSTVIILKRVTVDLTHTVHESLRLTGRG